MSRQISLQRRLSGHCLLPNWRDSINQSCRIVMLGLLENEAEEQANRAWLAADRLKPLEPWWGQIFAKQLTGPASNVYTTRWLAALDAHYFWANMQQCMSMLNIDDLFENER